MLIGCLAVAAATEPHPQSKPRPKPSLDALLLRANSYWSLLEKKDKLEALKYATPSSRKTLLARQDPPISNPRVTGFQLTGKPDEVQVIVTVKRFLPEIGTLDWPVHEKWVFKNGNWFVDVAGPAPQFPSRPGKQPASLSAEEVERRQAEVKAALRFDRQVIDFGIVRKGTSASFDLKYSLAGSEPVEVLFKDAPADLLVYGLEGGMLKPGTDVTLPMQWVTQNYDGQVQAIFTLVARQHQVEVPFQFDLRGVVYTPVSALPAQVTFRENEQQAELVVRNNSKFEVRIASFLTQTNSVTVQSLPQTLAPGSQVTLTVRPRLKIAQKNYHEMVSLDFEHPVEGMASLIVPVLLNYEKPAEIQRVPGIGLTPQEIEELVKKARQQPDNKP